MTDEQQIEYDKEMWSTANHEAGHAVAAWKTWVDEGRPQTMWGGPLLSVGCFWVKGIILHGPDFSNSYGCVRGIYAGNDDVIKVAGMVAEMLYAPRPERHAYWDGINQRQLKQNLSGSAFLACLETYRKRNTGHDLATLCQEKQRPKLFRAALEAGDILQTYRLQHRKLTNALVEAGKDGLDWGDIKHIFRGAK